MAVPVQWCDLVYQHPQDRVLWAVAGVPEPRLVRVRRVRPVGDGKELQATIQDGAVLIHGGFNGARYEITLQDGVCFQVRFTDKGVETVTGPKGQAQVTLVKAIARGKAIVPVGVTYQVRDIHG